MIDVLIMNNRKNKSGIFPTIVSLENICVW